MKTIKGPGIYLAQFVGDAEPFNSIEGMAKWASSLGYKGFQVPTDAKSLIDLDKAAESKDYCDEFKGKLSENGIELIELGSYLEGQCMAYHKAYEAGFAHFHPQGLPYDKVKDWAAGELAKSIKASVNFGTKNISAMSGGLLWKNIYPWPQRPGGLVDEAFTELARRWRPILDLAAENDISFGYELHPGSDLYDGATYERFLEKVDNHPAACITYDPSHFVLQQLDYCHFIKLYGERIRAFHVKDAEFNPDGRVGVYGGYQDWIGRAGRFRSPGDGQVDFTRIFSLLAEAGYGGWAILEWECCIKSAEQGAREGAPFITEHIIEVTDKAFDDFVGAESNRTKNRKMLGLEE